MGAPCKPLIRYALIAVLILVGTSVAWWAWTRNPFYTPPLVDAAMESDAQAARAAIARGAELNRRTWVFGTDNFSGWTALMWAAYRRDAATVRILMDAGADTQVQDKFGRSALHLTFYGDKVGSAASCVSILLSNGADPKSVNLAGETPLHNAVLSGDTDSIKMLIDAGADVNALTAEGTPVLSYAIFNRKDVDIVRLLLDKGANVAQPLPNGKRLDQVIGEADVEPAIVNAIKDAGK